MNREKIKEKIMLESKRLGFDFCGFAPAEYLEEDAKRLDSWLTKNYHAEMHYMENNFDLRVDIRKLFPSAKTVLVFLKNYFSENKYGNDQAKISRYAYGKDYHKVIKKKLKQIYFEIQQFGEIGGRYFVDSAPVLERTWATKAGLGWVGKNGMLINKKVGSFYFIAVMVLDIDLNVEKHISTNHCGTCNRCIEACPTQAILPNKEINASQCISYFTIELKSNEINSDKDFKHWMFGCDICQEVCPWNRFSIQNSEPDFIPNKKILSLDTKAWLEMEKSTFDEISLNSPLRRSKLEGIQRNIKYLLKNNS